MISTATRFARGCPVRARRRLAVLAGCAAVVLVAAAPAGAAATFKTHVEYAIGTVPPAPFSVPYSVAIGDLNSDGKPDLVTADSNGGAVAVLLGNGDGTFMTNLHFPVGATPYSVAIGDLDGDGHPDLAVANKGSNNVSVLLGNGNGTFRAAVNYAAGNGPYSVAIGDFNGDGKPDLAVADSGDDGGVSVLLGNGDGTFETAAVYPTGAAVASVAIGDLNGDGKLDLAVAGGGHVSVLLGNGDGTFKPHVDYIAAVGPDSVAIGDLNGDGKPDLAVADGVSKQVSVLLGNGDGTFGTTVNYPTPSGGLIGAFSVAIGDLNGDGHPDLAVATVMSAGFSSGQLSVLLGNGDGTFNPHVDLDAGSFPNSVAIGDLNGDGKPDLAAADGSGKSLSVLLNTTMPAVVAITAPAAGADYAQGQAVAASYTCRNAVSCKGLVSSGSPIPTSTAGAHSFTVTATDTVGEKATKTVHYTVTAAPPATPPATPPAHGSGGRPKHATGRVKRAKITTRKTRLRHGRVVAFKVKCVTRARHRAHSRAHSSRASSSRARRRARSCKVKVKLRSTTRLHGKRRTLGTKTFRTRGAKAHKVRLRLTRRIARLIKRSHKRKIPIRARLTARSHGAKTTTRDKLTLKIPRGHGRRRGHHAHHGRDA